MATPTISEITSLADIQRLAIRGFSDWKQLGEVSVDQDGELLIFNYTAKAQYTGRWNFFEQVSRGLIINRRSGEVVARPFDKFFNWFENGRKASGHIVTVTEKMDGSLGILYRLEGGYRIATRGAFHSRQAEWATRFLNDRYDLSDLPPELTLLFEIVYPENRIVVDYGGLEALVLLAARNRFSGAYLPFYPGLFELGQGYGFPLPKVYAFNNITEILERTGLISPDEEGYVVEFSSGERFKFKGDRYLELHRLIFGLSFKHTLEAMAAGTVETIRSQIPDEFLGQFNDWVTQIETMVAATKQQVQVAFDAAPKTTRKDFALWVQAQHPELAVYLFAVLDGKNIEPLIYRTAFQNLPDERIVTVSENTA
ncbi:MAG: T4 RnlA family RNA ligase [Anaerolineae bacterium]